MIAQNHSSIFTAVKKNDTNTTQALLSEIDNLDQCDANGFTLLHWAAIVGNESAAKILLERGANISIKNVHGESAFHWAAWTGHLEIVKMLLAHGADSQELSARGKSALEGAVTYYHEDVVHFLVSLGLKPSKDWLTEDHWINTLSGSLENLKFLIEAVGTPIQTTLDHMLMIAAQDSKLEMIEFLLQRGAIPNIACCRNVECAALFLANKADINQFDEEGNTLLHRAICFQDTDLLKFALENNADMLLENPYGWTAFKLSEKYFKNKGAEIREKQLEIQALLARHYINHLTVANDSLPSEFIYILTHNDCFWKIDYSKINLPAASQCLKLLSIFLQSYRAPSLDNKLLMHGFVNRLLDRVFPGIIQTTPNPHQYDSDFKFSLLNDTRQAIVEKLTLFVSLAESGYFPCDVDGSLKTIFRDQLHRIEQANVNIVNQTQSCNFDAPIEVHASDLFRRVYSIAFRSGSGDSDIARYHHGIMHVSRAAIYVPVFVNLYRYYGDKDALKLTRDDIKLLQLSVLLHDAGREDEGVDFWDKDSGLMTYSYLSRLGVEADKAKLLAEAVANKDQKGSDYFQLNVAGDHRLWVSRTQSTKNIYQKIIHDADCLDIIRARDHYKAKYLDFYQDIGKYSPQAFNDMAELIIEARSLIETEGDGPCKNSERKKYYECEAAYYRILADIRQNKNFRILASLYTPEAFLSQEEIKKIIGRVNLPSYDSSRSLDEANVKAAMAEGKIYARALATPTKLRPDKRRWINKDFKTETLTQTELRKTARRIGIATSSSKPDRLSKQGNPNRSVSMIGYGSGVFSSAGFLIVNPNIDSITSISKKNACTGFGKKTNFFPAKLTREEKKEKINALITCLKMGGSSEKYADYAANHVEITYNLEDYDAIYYSQDPNPSNLALHETPQPMHRFSPMLEAIYIRNEYEALHGKPLPLFQYSGLHNTIRQVDEKEYGDEQLQEMWATICSDYLKNQSKQDGFRFIRSICNSIDHIKINAMYGENRDDDGVRIEYVAADSNYHEALREKINQAIYRAIEKILIEQLKNNNLSLIFNLCMIYEGNAYFRNQPDLIWIKSVLKDDAQLVRIVECITPTDRLNFLQKLGAEWISQFVVHPGYVNKILSCLNDIDRYIFTLELDQYDIKLQGTKSIYGLFSQRSGERQSPLIEHAENKRCMKTN